MKNEEKKYEFNWLAWFMAIICIICLVTCFYNYDSAEIGSFIFVLIFPIIFGIVFIKECVLEIKYMIKRRNRK